MDNRTQEHVPLDIRQMLIEIGTAQWKAIVEKHNRKEAEELAALWGDEPEGKTYAKDKPGSDGAKTDQAND